MQRTQLDGSGAPFVTADNNPSFKRGWYLPENAPGQRFAESVARVARIQAARQAGA
ncbi:hypothetical protein [Arthrobacter sp. YC-RL1]|uniref:hypothetical protein n=1 Tax=Arthrobacter sp. YC-RL1 TaxID=1652545 RepID=UPI0012FC59F3|nr:hypothetical protein [Arthrobacter sp. YC-RL1]